MSQALFSERNRSVFLPDVRAGTGSVYRCIPLLPGLAENFGLRELRAVLLKRKGIAAGKDFLISFF